MTNPKIFLNFYPSFFPGMILLSELSRRRIRSINKLIRVGRTEPVVVIRVDKDKGYIDLSKRRVSPEDVERCTEVFSKAKAVNSILRHVANILEYKSSDELEELYKKTAWHFEAKTKKKGSSYDWFKQVRNNVNQGKIAHTNTKHLSDKLNFALGKLYFPF